MYLTANTYSKKFQPFSEKKLSTEGQTTDICVNTYCLRKLTYWKAKPEMCQPYLPKDLAYLDKASQIFCSTYAYL